jgi:uncharacterized protein
VLVHTKLTLSGAVAQYGRGVGIIQLTAAQIITQFANNLKAQLAQEAVPAVAPSPQPSSPALVVDGRGGGARAQPIAPATKPISGFAVIAKVLWQSIKRLFSRA